MYFLPTSNLAAVQQQSHHSRSAQEDLRSEDGHLVAVQVDGGGVHGDLPGDRGEVPVSTLDDVHVPGLNVKKNLLDLIEIIMDKLNREMLDRILMKCSIFYIREDWGY